MKALTGHEPYPVLIAEEFKGIETRSWRPREGSLPMTIAIHAGATMPAYAREFANSPDIARMLRGVGYMGAISAKAGHRYERTMSKLKYLPTSAIVCVVDIYAFQATDQFPYGFKFTDEYKLGNYIQGRWAWHLTNVRKLDPIPCVGHQGLWNVPEDVLAQIVEQIGPISKPGQPLPVGSGR